MVILLDFPQVWALAVGGYNFSTTGIHKAQTFVVHVLVSPMLLVPPAVLLEHSTHPNTMIVTITRWRDILQFHLVHEITVKSFPVRTLAI